MFEPFVFWGLREVPYWHHIPRKYWIISVSCINGWCL